MHLCCTSELAYHMSMKVRFQEPMVDSGLLINTTPIVVVEMKSGLENTNNSYQRKRYIQHSSFEYEIYSSLLPRSWMVGRATK